ncbi:MAG: GntR family transcriptional regulator [Eubacterium sp.]|nr:GntR family transcriptional regulator [Eubacterium sp.]
MFKYESIAADIQNKIYSGVYQADTKLPQETELCKLYDASRITVREALDNLVRQGLITRRRGAGTYVKPIVGENLDPELLARSQQFGGFTSDMKGRKVESEVHEFTLLRAPIKVAEKLQVSEDAFVCYICRTRFVDGEPYVVEYTYMPTDFISGITEEVVNHSIYAYIEGTLKLKIKSAHRSTRADMPTEQELKWLQIKKGEMPVLEIEQTAYLDDGRIFEYSKSRHRADCFILHTVSVR